MTAGLNSDVFFYELFQTPETSLTVIGGEVILSKRLRNQADNDAENASIFAIRRKKSWDDEGVAATVGTILSLMVFLTFLGMFTNQYVPIWMKENESNHMNTVVGELSNLKSGVDMQVLNNNEQVASAPIYSPIKLHAEGVPVFASPTLGVLVFTAAKDSGGASVIITYNFTAGSSSYTLDQSNGGKTGGSIEFLGANRYFIQQNVTYECGAILLNQSDGESMLSGIAIRIVNNGGVWSMKLTLTSLTGVDKTIGGSGTKSITSTLEYTNYQKLSNSSGSPVNLTIVTKYPYAWESYFKSLLNKSGVPYNPANVVRGTTVILGNSGYRTVTVSIPNITNLEYTKAVATISIADIGV